MTSLRHLAHLCRAYLVKLTRKGISIIDRMPKTRIARMATRYPKKLVLYSTIENDTASQKGHLTFVDLKRLKLLNLTRLRIGSARLVLLDSGIGRQLD